MFRAPDPRPRWPTLSERQLFWALQCAGWSLITPMVFLSIRPAFADPREAALLTGVRIIAGVVLTSFLLRPVYRHLRSGHWSLPVLGLIVFVVCGVTSYFDIEASDILIERLQKSAVRNWAPGLGQAILYTRWMLFLVWSLLYFGIGYWRSIQKQRVKLLEIESANRQAELQLLRAQINPHFLFNALNTTLAEKEDPEKVELIVQALAEYLRFSMKQGDGLAPLGVELEALQSYLRVEKFRFEQDLLIEIDVTREAAGTPVPTSLVQPLVENAIKFGRMTSPLPLRLRIGARRDHDALHLDVANSGTWVPEGSTNGTGIGLANLKRRLALILGDTAALTTTSRDGWVQVGVRVPVIPRAS